MTAAEVLAAWQNAANAATEGPWSADIETDWDEDGQFCYPVALVGPVNHGTLASGWLSEDYKAQYGHRVSEVSEMTPADAEFAALSRDALPRAVAALQAVLDARDAWASEPDARMDKGWAVAVIDRAINAALGVEP